MNLKAPLTFLILTLFANQPAVTADYRDRADLLIEDLVNERFKAVVSNFTTWLAENHPADEIKEIWYETITRYGPCQNHYFGEVIEKDTTTSYLYVLEFESGVFVAVVAFNSRGEVMTFILRPPEGKPIITRPFWIVPDYREATDPVYRIPSYVDTSAFNEVEFVMHGGAPLPATLTTAITDEPNPVVLLFHGFGPADRDETIGSLKPLRDIAWGLASQGIASIRFDSRAYTQPLEIIAGYDLNKYLLNDLEAMLAYIRMESAIFDTTRIFIAGHGLGGMAAPLAAQRDGGLAGLILLSAPARPFGEMLMQTVKNDLAADDKGESIDREQLNEVAAILDSLKKRLLPPDEMIIFAPAQVWYDLMDDNHVDISRRLDLPLLIIHSGRDFETAEADYEIWNKNLADRPNTTFKRYDDLNHFYQPGQGPAGKNEYLSNTAPVDGGLIDDLANWIKSK